MRIQCDEHPDTWAQWLPFWCFTFNTTVHTETRYQPFELVFGKSCNLPSSLSDRIDVLYNPDNYVLELRYRLQKASNDARKNLIKSKDLRKVKYDENSKEINFVKDDLVLIKNESGNKVEKLYNGPYKVLEDLGPNVKIVKDNKIEIVHKNRTKMYYE